MITVVMLMFSFASMAAVNLITEAVYDDLYELMGEYVPDECDTHVIIAPESDGNVEYAEPPDAEPPIVEIPEYDDYNSYEQPDYDYLSEYDEHEYENEYNYEYNDDYTYEYDDIEDDVGIEMLGAYVISDFGDLNYLFNNVMTDSGFYRIYLADTITMDMTLTIPAGMTVVFNGFGVGTLRKVTGGRHFVVDGGTLILEDITLCGANATTHRGGVVVSQGGRLYLEAGSIITGNMAVNGGGVDVVNGVITINEGFVSRNNASGCGGGIRVNAGALVMNSGSINNNTANTHGGGVCVNGTFVMYDGVISNNRSTNVSEDVGTRGGGGVRVSDTGTFTMHHGIIFANLSFSSGGGICSSGITTIYNGLVVDNTAVYGGGVNWGTAAELQRIRIFSNATFSSNTATAGFKINDSLNLAHSIRINPGSWTYVSGALNNTHAFNNYDIRSVLEGLIEPTPSTLLVMVENEDGEPIPYAAVVIRDENGYIILDCTTDIGGWHFAELYNGAYYVYASHPDFKDLEELIHVVIYNSDKEITINLESYPVLPPTFEITFDLAHSGAVVPTNVSGMPSDRLVYYNEAIYTDGGMVSTPSSIGYIFDGWVQVFPEAPTGSWELLSSEDVSNIIVTQNMMFVGAWTRPFGPPPPIYTITFEPGGTGVTGIPGDRVILQNQEIGTVISPSRENYMFIGWLQIVPAGTGEVLSPEEIGNVIVIGDMTFVAQWEEIEEPPPPPPPDEYRNIRVYYYLRDENGNLNRDMDNNPTGRQYIYRVGTAFDLAHVLDRNTLPSDNVYVFEGWLVHLGGISHQNYISDLDTSDLYGSFIVPAPTANTHILDDTTNINTLSSVIVGDVIGLVAVWVIYESAHDDDDDDDDVDDDDVDDDGDDEEPPEEDETPSEPTEPTYKTARWSLRNFHNYTNRAVSEFTIINVPGERMNFASAELPAFTGGIGITYDIVYMVYGSGVWQVYRTGIDASQPFSFELSQPGNLHYSAIGFFFGAVPAGFGQDNEIVIDFTVESNISSNALQNRFSVQWAGGEHDNNAQRSRPATSRVR